jgi:1,4-dihydroxy-2-naphthoate octaprenyltransferase
MWNKLTAFVRLARPHFLLGGLLLYALGAVIARYEGYPIDFRVYWIGQLFVTGIQLMTQFLNEYWDGAADRLNTARTLFSGGSGMVGPGGFKRRLAVHPNPRGGAGPGHHGAGLSWRLLLFQPAH